MIAAGHKLVESNPFTSPVPDFGRPRETSPQALRVRAMWAAMRDKVLKVFPADPGISKSAADLLQSIKDVYRHDAYNSLSIEGFDVTEGLIERVRTGTWDPAGTERDSRTKDALAAKGYADAFNRVLESVSRVLRGEHPGEVADRDLHNWYTALFGPSVRAGIIGPADLAGYRNGPVYIRGADHVPPNPVQVPAMMEELFALMKEESSAAVRAVLGHFIFVHIHPFMDGNGRTARFLIEPDVRFRRLALDYRTRRTTTPQALLRSTRQGARNANRNRRFRRISARRNERGLGDGETLNYRHKSSSALRLATS